MANNEQGVKRAGLDKEEWKEAYKIAFKLNKFSKEEMAILHGVSENAVDKYLYADSRYPRFDYIYEMYCYIVQIDGVLPIELNRIVHRPHNRAIVCAKYFDKFTGRKSYKKMPKPVGKRLHPREYKFILDGDTVTFKDLMKKHNVSRHTVKRRIEDAGVPNGGDVSGIDFVKRSKWDRDR